MLNRIICYFINERYPESIDTGKRVLYQQLNFIGYQM